MADKITKDQRNKTLYDLLFIIGLAAFLFGFFLKNWSILIIGSMIMLFSFVAYEVSLGKHPKEKLFKFFKYLTKISSLLALAIISYTFAVNRSALIGFFQQPLNYDLQFYSLIAVFLLSFIVISSQIIKYAFKSVRKQKEPKKQKIKPKAEKKYLFSKLFKRKKEKNKQKVEKKTKEHLSFFRLFKTKENKAKRLHLFGVPKKKETEKPTVNKIVNLYGIVFIISIAVALVAFVSQQLFTFFITLIVMVTSLSSYLSIKKAKEQKKQKKELKEHPLRKRHLFSLILFDIVTLGLYFFYWYYSVNKDIKKLTKSDFKPELYLLGSLIPIFNFYVFYKTAVKIRDIQLPDKLDFEIKPIPVVINAILLIPYQLIVQNNMNKYLDVHTGKVELTEVVLPERKQLKKEEEKHFQLFKKWSKTEEYLEKVERRRIEIKPKPYETDLDILKRLIDEKGTIKIAQVAQYFGISRELAEEWGKILEGSDLAKLHYPAIGEPELIKWKDQQKNII